MDYSVSPAILTQSAKVDSSGLFGTRTHAQSAKVDARASSGEISILVFHSQHQRELRERREPGERRELRDPR